MNLRTFLLTLVFAGVWAAAYFGLGPVLFFISGILDDAHNPLSTFPSAAVWLILSFPFALVVQGGGIPPRFNSPALGAALMVANALLWGWCAARLFLLVRRRSSRPSA